MGTVTTPCLNPENVTGQLTVGLFNSDRCHTFTKVIIHKNVDILFWTRIIQNVNKMLLYFLVNFFLYKCLLLSLLLLLFIIYLTHYQSYQSLSIMNHYQNYLLTLFT